jgi:hypothetical protein
VFERFERFFFALQSICRDANVVLQLASTAQPIRMAEIHQRPLVVGLLERGSATLEVLPRRRIVWRPLRCCGYGANQA